MMGVICGVWMHAVRKDGLRSWMCFAWWVHAEDQIQELGAICVVYACGFILHYSKGCSHRNRPTGGSQSISKCAREIGPTVSQFLFLNVHSSRHPQRRFHKIM